MIHARRSLRLVLAGMCLAVAWPSPAAAQFFPYFRSGRRYATVMGGPLGPAPLDPYSVAAYWGFFPSPLVARQSIGHEVIWTGPNGYVYRPVYADQDPAGAGQSDGFSVLPATPAAPPNAASAGTQPDPGAAVELKPANPLGLFDLALVLFRTGRYDEALGRLDQLLLNDPQNGQAELLSAEALFAQGEYEGAVAALDRATQKLPAEEWARFTADYGSFFPSALRYAVHLRTLERYVDRFPDAPASRMLLAWQYGSLEFFDQALAQLKQLKPSALSRRLSEHYARQPKRPADELPAPAPDPDLELNAPENGAPDGEEVRQPVDRAPAPVARRVGPREF